MATDLPSVSYLALYIISVHVLNTNSRTSTHWKLNPDSGKVEVAALAASGDGTGLVADPLLNILTSRVELANGEWKLESEQTCYENCRKSETVEKKSENSTANSSRANKVKESCVTPSTTKETSKAEKRRSKAVVDCGKPVASTNIDHLRSIANRDSHPHVPEPEVAMIFRTKGSTEVDMDQLEVQLKAAKKEKPRSPQIYNQIGNFWRIKGDTQRSIECFRRALALSPNNSDVLLNLARVLFNLHELDDALELTKRSLDMRMPDQNAWLQHFTLAEIHRARGRRREAIHHFRRTLDLHQNFHPALVHLQELETETSSEGLGGGGGGGGTAVTYYTLFIILLLVLGVLCGVLTSVDAGFDDGDAMAGGKTQRHFNRAMAMRSIKLGINPKLIRMRKQYGC
jgi:tetratricopeptide (TPR) repeat protein